MKRSTFALFTALLLTATPLFAIQGGPKVKPPKPPAAAKSTTTKVKPVTMKTTVSKPMQATKAPKPVKATSVKTAKATTKPVKVEKVKTVKADKTTKSASAASTTPTTTTSDTPTTTDPVTLTKVQEKLQRNTNLANKLKDRLPLGTDLMLAAEGFTSLGKFVSAVNVSYNHPGIEFEALKTLIVDEGFSLGQAMQKLKAESNVTLEVQRAESEAQKMIAASEAGSTSTTTVATPTTTATSTKTKKPKKPVGGQQ